MLKSITEAQKTENKKKITRKNKLKIFYQDFSRTILTNKTSSSCVAQDKVKQYIFESNTQ